VILVNDISNDHNHMNPFPVMILFLYISYMILTENNSIRIILILYDLLTKYEINDVYLIKSTYHNDILTPVALI
jgi:hypothetical protein